MFERLFELFLHAKTGLIAGVFLVGTTGALVTATVQNGVTTITLTEASPSPSGSATISPSVSPSPSGTATARATATATATATALISSSTRSSESGTTSTSCDATQAHAAADAVKTVDSAFSQYHTDLSKLRKDAKGDSSRTIIENADKALKEIRQNAVKAIHATVTCAKDDDDKDANTQDKNNEQDNEDEDKGDDSKKSSAPSANSNFLVVLLNNLLGKHNTTVTNVTPTPTPALSPATTVVTTTSGDVKKIADDAVAAMKFVFDTAKSQLATANTTAATPKPTKSPRPTSPDTKDKGHGDSGGDHGD